MCPACITTAMLTAVGASSTGGLTALAWKNFVGNELDHGISTCIVSRDSEGPRRSFFARCKRSTKKLSAQKNNRINN